jgi:hypothetical protein
MQKEVLTNKIRAFAEFALSNPATAQKIDVTELLQQTWDVMEIGKESPILQEEGEEKIPEAVKQQVQVMDQTIQKMQQHIDMLEQKEAAQQLKIDADLKKAQIAAQTAAEKQVDTHNVARYEAETARMAQLAPAMGPEEIRALVKQLMQEMMSPEQVPPQPPTAPPEEPEMPEPPPQPMPPTQPADAGFLTPPEQ